jgi:hypothetical protein
MTKKKFSGATDELSRKNLENLNDNAYPSLSFQKSY